MKIISHKLISFRKVASVLTLLTFIFGQIVMPSMARAEIGMLGTVPLRAGTVPNTAFAPPVLLGLKIHPENPLLFDFIVDRGQVKLFDEQFKAETIKLVKYFLAALTIPDKESWVNLSPTEKDRIIPDALGRTEMGKTMLEQDYVLKQLAASLTNPQTELGRKYWANVGNGRDRSLQKVWIVPEKAKVIESNGIVLVDEKKLKVLMAEEYENSMSSPRKRGSILNDQEKMDSRFRGNDRSGGNANFPNQAPGPNHQEPSFEVFHNLILPRINQEINESQSFAPVRQIYNSVILAAWYKQALKESLLGKVYTDKAKTAGVETDDKQMKERVYQQYLEAFKKGAYNFIKEEEDPATGEMIPRKYFSGGLTIAASAVLERVVSSSAVKDRLEASASTLNEVTILGMSKQSLLLFKGRPSPVRRPHQHLWL